jgi:hypothetical protein
MTLTVGNRELFRGLPLVVLALCSFTFLGLRTIEGTGGLSGWPASYLDDLLCLPLVLGLVLAVHRLRHPGPGLILIRGHSLVALLLFSVYFEVILPRLSSGFTADPVDVVMYGIGWCVFEWGINRPGPA